MARARLTRDDPGLRPGVLARGRIGGDPLAAERDGEIVAGVAVNRSTQVVGLSNFFAASSTPTRSSRTPWRRFAVSLLDLPVVGYESGESLARARREGFHAVGALRIWILEP